MQTHEIINILQNEPSTNKKIEILKQNKDNKELNEFFRLALSPEVIFGIKKIPEYQHEEDQSLQWAMYSLSSLSDRTYTGNTGIEYLQQVLSCVSPENADLIERIIKKDPNCGCDYKSINKMTPNLIKTFPVALCERNSEKSRKHITPPFFVQCKEDSIRINAIVKDGEVQYRTRNGKEIDLLDNLVQDFLKLADGMNVVFDGEAICIDKDVLLPRKVSAGILNKAIKNTITDEEAKLVHVVLWDMIPYDDFINEKCLYPYNYRFSELEERVTGFDKIHLVDNYTVNSWDEATVIFNRYLSMGREGVIVKDKNGIWENKRLKTQIKLKAELSADLECIGVEPHSKNPNMIGSLVLVTSCGGLKTNCGSGLTDADRLKDPSEYLNKVIEVKYNEIISKENDPIKSLFLPIFTCVRVDKDFANSLKELK